LVIASYPFLDCPQPGFQSDSLDSATLPGESAPSPMAAMRAADEAAAAAAVIETVTVLAEKLMEDDAEGVVRKVIEAAMAGGHDGGAVDPRSDRTSAQRPPRGDGLAGRGWRRGRDRRARPFEAGNPGKPKGARHRGPRVLAAYLRAVIQLSFVDWGGSAMNPKRGRTAGDNAVRSVRPDLMPPDSDSSNPVIPCCVLRSLAPLWSF
jgi:hypothetical protein